MACGKRLEKWQSSEMSQGCQEGRGAMMPEVITLGEAMVLFSPQEPGSLKHVHSFSKRVGGAESNLAIALARLGHAVGWIGKVGRDPFGEFVLSTIRGEGVDVSQAIFADGLPTGIMFKEQAGFNETNVYYYRKESAASYLGPVNLHPEYFSTAKFLHITGITPALSGSCLETVKYALQLAKQYQIKVSLDPNVRLKLWSAEQAKSTLLSLLKQVDFCLPGQDEAYLLTGRQDPEEQADALLALGPTCVVVKLNDKRVYYKSASQAGVAPAFRVEEIVDTVGAGDGFAAGFLSGLLDGLDLPQAVQRGCAVGAFALRSKGDFEGYPTRRELDVILGRKRVIQR